MAKTTKKKPDTKPDPAKDIVAAKKAATSKKVTTVKKSPATKKSPAAKVTPKANKVPANTKQSPIKVSSYDVEDIFLLPHVTENKMSFQLRKQPLSNLLIQKEWKKNLRIPEDDEIIVNNLENKLKNLKEGGEDFKRFFVMYVCSTFLAPVANRVIDYKIINYADNVKEIHNLDWCGYVMNNLCKSVGSFKNNKKKESRSGISGCILILQLVYFHHLAFRGKPEPTTLPLIQHWSDEKVKERIAKEANASFGQGELQKDDYPEIEEELHLLTRDSQLFAMIHAERITTLGEKMKMQQMNVSTSNSQQVSETQRLMEDPRVQRAMDEIVKLYDDLRNVSSVILSTWEEQHKTETDPKTFEEDVFDPKTVHLDELDVDNQGEKDPENQGVDADISKVEEMSNFLKRINHEKADEILEYEFDEVKFKWKTPRYTLDCGVFAMIHMLCFSGETFDSYLDLANRRNVYRAEICATLALADINTKRKQLQRKISRFRKHKEVMDNMSLQCYQVVDYLAINDGENFPNKSKVVGWFIDSIEIVRQDCNALLNEWKVSSNVITAWSNHLNNIEMEKDRSENDLVRYFFGFDFMDALTMCLIDHGKKGVTSLQKLWIDWNTSQSLDLDAAQCVYIPLMLEDHYFLVVINFKDETIDHPDITLYETNEEYEPVQSFILEMMIQVQKLFKKWKHRQENDMLTYKMRIIELPFQKEREDNFSASYLLLHMKVYDGANGIGLGTIKEEFARLNHHHIRLVLDLLLNERNKMKQKLLTNVEDWEEKKESEQFSAAVASTFAAAASNSATNATVANAMSL
uniref:Ubiquitin-like protease family profile domain-containing protein n=1 Tax=Chenopodium quinoa TaxID=63459 RepID=A0A803M6L4_CHEQI